MINKLTLRNFKGFRKTTIPLGPLTLLVGTNASGKSNVREALQFLHGCGQGYSLAEIIGAKWGQGGIQIWRGLRGGVREIAFMASNLLTFKRFFRKSKNIRYPSSLRMEARSPPV